MTKLVQHDGLLNILESVFALYKSKHITNIKLDGGKKGGVKKDISKGDIRNLKKYAQYLIDKDKSQYYMHVEAMANFPEDEKLRGIFELFYNPVSIRVEAVTDELAEEISKLLKSSFISSSLFDLLKSINDW